MASHQIYQNVLTVDARAESLPAKDFRGKADPYLVIKIPRQIEGELHVPYGGHGDAHAKHFGTGVKVGSVATKIFTGAAVGTAAVITAPLLLAIAIPTGMGYFGGKAIKHASKTHEQTQGFEEIFSSPVMKKNLNPNWPSFQLAFHEHYFNSPDAKLLIECWDYGKFTASDFIGYCMLTVSQLRDNSGEQNFQLVSKEGAPRGFLFLKTSCSSAPAEVVEHAAQQQQQQLNQNEHQQQQQQQFELHGPVHLREPESQSNQQQQQSEHTQQQQQQQQQQQPYYTQQAGGPQVDAQQQAVLEKKVGGGGAFQTNTATSAM